MRQNIVVEIAGRPVTGYCEVKDDMVTVSYSGGSKTTQVGGSPPETIARIMLREMISEASR